jgi:hypothetical protein
MTRLYTDDAEFYDIAFDWDVNAEVGGSRSRPAPAPATSSRRFTS